MKAKLKEKKKKAKEKRSKDRVLRRREATRAKAREDRRIENLDKASMEPLEPIIDTVKLMDRDIGIAKNDIVEAKDMGSSEKVIKALEHNLDILKSMKQEYMDEQQEKKTLNEELENAGCKTLEDKVEYLNQQAQQLNKDENEAGNVGGTAEVKWSPNPPKKRRKRAHEKKETANCDVIKAEDREDLKNS